MHRSIDTQVACVVTTMVGICAVLAGCSDIYFDRRESILFGADDAVASNMAVQTIDPWPSASANRRAPANGERVAAAIKRYRTGRVFIPIGNATSSSYQQQQQQQMMSLDSQPATGPGTAMSSGTGPGATQTGNSVQLK
jgi:hypothetical protein